MKFLKLLLLLLLLPSSGFSATNLFSDVWINRSLRMTFGTPGAGRVFTSDSVGVGTWQVLVNTNTVSDNRYVIKAGFSSGPQFIDGALTISNDFTAGASSLGLFVSNANGFVGIANPNPAGVFRVEIPTTMISSATTLLSPTASNSIPLVIQGAPAQVSNYFSVVTSTGSDALTLSSSIRLTLAGGFSGSLATAGSVFGGGSGINGQVITINQGAAAQTNLVIKGFSAAATGPLTIWSSSANVTLAQVSSNGLFNLNNRAVVTSPNVGSTNYLLQITNVPLSANFGVLVSDTGGGTLRIHNQSATPGRFYFLTSENMYFAGQNGVGTAANIYLNGGTTTVDNGADFLTTGSSTLGDATTDLTTVNSFRHLGGATSTNRYSATAVLDFPSTTAGESQLSITVTGAATGDEASIGVPFVSAVTGGAFTQYTSNNTVWIRFSNPSAVAIDPASGTFRGTVWKY